jgi:integrase/recombinase XerD
MYPELPPFKSWLKCQYPNSSASVHYSSDLALFFSFVKKPPARVTYKDVDRYIVYSQQQGHKPSTINRRLSALRTFYYFLAMTCGLPPSCPVLPRHRRRKSYPLPKDMTEREVEILFTSIDQPRDTAMFRLMLDCGLRVREVHSLSLDDICLEDPPHFLVQGKGGKQRIVYFSPPTLKVFQAWLASRPINKDRAVFISERGKRLSIAGVQFLLKEYCGKVGISITCHQLRHTFARRMAEAKMPLTSLQTLLGHKSVRTTQLYVHLSDGHLQCEYDQAMTRTPPPEPACVPDSAKRLQRPHTSRAINWDGYLTDLPDWLADLIRDYCSHHSQAQDLVQQARNRLSQLSGVFRWLSANSAFSCLEPLTPRLWFGYVETRLKAGRKPASINTTLRILQAFLKSVRDTGTSICEGTLEIRPLKTGEVLPRHISEAELNQLLQHAPLFDQAWVLMMAHSGLRTCEIRNLRWQDVDLQRHTLRIHESKRLRSRLVFLSEATIQVLQKLPPVSEYVFTCHNQLLSSRYCQSRLTTLGRKCGMHVTPHQLRHTCATMLLNSGMSIFGVQTILGHKYIDTTLRYAEVYSSTVAKDYQLAMQRATRSEDSHQAGGKWDL